MAQPPTVPQPAQRPLLPTALKARAGRHRNTGCTFVFLMHRAQMRACSGARDSLGEGGSHRYRFKLQLGCTVRTGSEVLGMRKHDENQTVVKTKRLLRLNSFFSFQKPPLTLGKDLREQHLRTPAPRPRPRAPTVGGTDARDPHACDSAVPPP